MNDRILHRGTFSPVLGGPAHYVRMVSEVTPSAAPQGNIAYYITKCFAIERGGVVVKLCPMVRTYTTRQPSLGFLSDTTYSWTVRRAHADEGAYAEFGSVYSGSPVPGEGLDGCIVGSPQVVSWPVFALPNQNSSRTGSKLKYESKFEFAPAAPDADTVIYSLFVKEWVQASPDYSLSGFLGAPPMWVVD